MPCHLAFQIAPVDQVVDLDQEPFERDSLYGAENAFGATVLRSAMVGNSAFIQAGF